MPDESVAPYNPNDAIRLEGETPQSNAKSDGVLRFNVVLKSKPVEITDATGRVKTYTLWEMTGEQKDDYLTENAKRVQIAPDGKSGMVTSFKNVNAMLIEKCLISDDTRKNVDRKAIQTWPSSVQIALYAECLKLNGLDQESADREKKD
jgi:hypothetical protein